MAMVVRWDRMPRGVGRQNLMSWDCRETNQLAEQSPAYRCYDAIRCPVADELLLSAPCMFMWEAVIINPSLSALQQLCL